MPGALDWTDAQRQKRAVAEYLAGLEAEARVQEDGNSRDGGSGGKSTAASYRKSSKVISPSTLGFRFADHACRFI